MHPAGKGMGKSPTYPQGKLHSVEGTHWWISITGGSLRVMNPEVITVDTAFRCLQWSLSSSDSPQ